MIAVMPVYHVITPGDHFSPRTGSAIPTVVHGLAKAASAAAGPTASYPQRIVLQRDTFRPRYSSAAPVEYDGVPAPNRRERYVDGILGRLGMTRRAAARYWRPAADRLAEEPPGIVLAHNAPLLPWLLRDGPHIPVLYAHNDLLRSYSRAEAARVIESAALVICVSESLADRTRSELPTHLRDRVRVVGNGVDTELFAPARGRGAEPPRVMFLGRTIPEKGADILLAAAGQMPLADIEYVIVGSHGFDPNASLTPYERELRDLAAKVRGSVAFRPFVPRAELPELLSSADVLVVPSRWAEPWALTVGEGLATGLPVIASRVGGIPEALGDAGILFDPSRPEQLAQAITELIEDPERRAALGRDARQRAESRDWAWSWRQLALTLDELAAPGRHLQ